MPTTTDSDLYKTSVDRLASNEQLTTKDLDDLSSSIVALGIDQKQFHQDVLQRRVLKAVFSGSGTRSKQLRDVMSKVAALKQAEPKQ